MPKLHFCGLSIRLLNKSLQVSLPLGNSQRCSLQQQIITGATALILTPAGDHSTASDLVRLLTAALAAPL